VAPASMPVLHHHLITKSSHSINAIGPAPHRGGRKSSASCRCTCQRHWLVICSLPVVSVVELLSTMAATGSRS
jgi:hypothetical protein